MTDTPKSDDDAQDESGPVKPQVIDLEAEDVTIAEPVRETEAAEAPEPAPPKPAKAKSGTGKWLALALVAGLAGGAWAYRDLLSAYLPSKEMTALQARVDVLEANGRTQADQIVAIDQAATAAGKQAAGLDQALKDASALAGEARSGLAGLSDRLAAQEQAMAALRQDLDALRQAASSGAAGGGAVDSSALVALGQRVDALEKDLASLKAGAGKNEGAAGTAALSQALSDLKAKVAAGVAYSAEYERIARMVPAAPGLDVLALNADAGLPDAAGLAAELRAAIPALPQPAAPAATATDGYFDWAWDMLSGVVTIRDIGEANWPQVAEKAAALAESGDLAQAIDVIDQTEGTKPAALATWRDRAAGRLALLKALDETNEAVLRQIAAQGGAQ